MHNLLGSPKIIVSLFYFLCLWSRVAGPCPNRCDCNDEILRVTCDSANLDVVPITLNPELRELRLSKNHIKRIGASFSVYHKLEFLDLSYNELKTLDKDNFAMLQRLKVILVSGNMISLLQNDTFKGLVALTTLHLNENFLQNVPSKLFVHLENLELLDLFRNRIESIDQDAFFGLKNLKTLLLRDNKLTYIPSASFRHISKLFRLDLGLNAYGDIPENSFSALKDLQELTLDGCSIRAIQYGAFKWLTSLLILRIHNNELREVPTKALFDVIRLEELHIGQNKFVELKANSFQRLKYLHTIEVNGCSSLEQIEKGAFSDNANLKNIVISHNKALKHIQNRAFDNLPNIQHVSFRGNAFQTFQYSLLPWDELLTFDVRDNPLICNCSLLWLWKLLVTKNFTSVETQTDTTQVVCANPLGLKDRVLANLQEDDLDCYNMDARRQILITLLSTGGAVFALILILGFRYRDRFAGALKTKWVRGRKEPHYQKTSAEEESTILQAAQQSLKMIPVTEL